MKARKRYAASSDWAKFRRKTVNKRFQAAYAERRLELEVAALIYKLRRKQGISQQELARRLGTKQSAIARLEGGGENLTVARLQRIAWFLGAQVRIELESTVS